jgi:hypothetical protein
MTTTPPNNNPSRPRGFVIHDGQRFMANEYREGSYCVDDAGQKYRRIKTLTDAAAWIPILETMPGMENPDPINRPMRGISQADLGPMPTYPVARPPVLGTADFVDEPLKVDHLAYDVGAQMKEADGPNYAADQPVNPNPPDDALWLRIDINADLIPDRVQDMFHTLAVDTLPSFARRNLEYRDADRVLGYRGQFAELSHIMAKLKKLVWDDTHGVGYEHILEADVKRELNSLIGHAVLALGLVEEGNKNGR